MMQVLYANILVPLISCVSYLYIYMLYISGRPNRYVCTYSYISDSHQSFLSDIVHFCLVRQIFLEHWPYYPQSNVHTYMIAVHSIQIYIFSYIIFFFATQITDKHLICVLKFLRSILNAIFIAILYHLLWYKPLYTIFKML